MRPFQHSAPITLPDARNAANATTAGVMARTNGLTPTGAIPRGAGNDLLDLMKEGLVSPEHLLDVRGIPELQGVSPSADGSVRIGAAVRIAELETHPEFQKPAFRAVSDAAAHIAHPQIRNTATVAGSLLQRPRCWYFRLEEVNCAKKGGSGCPAIDGQNQFHAIFDTNTCPIVHPATLATVFLALDAEVELVGRNGPRTVPVAEFLVRPEVDVTRENILRPGEIVTGVHIPPSAARGVSHHLKQGQRESYDWAIVDVAVSGRKRGSTLSDVRVALGSVAPVPMRARAAEAVLQQQGATPDAFRAAARAATEGATPLSKNRYKVPVLETVVRRALEGAFA